MFACISALIITGKLLEIGLISQTTDDFSEGSNHSSSTISRGTKTPLTRIFRKVYSLCIATTKQTSFSKRISQNSPYFSASQPVLTQTNGLDIQKIHSKLGAPSSTNILQQEQNLQLPAVNNLEPTSSTFPIFSTGTTPPTSPLLCPSPIRLRLRSLEGKVNSKLSGENTPKSNQTEMSPKHSLQLASPQISDESDQKKSSQKRSLQLYGMTKPQKNNFKIRRSSQIVKGTKQFEKGQMTPAAAVVPVALSSVLNRLEQKTTKCNKTSIKQSIYKKQQQTLQQQQGSSQAILRLGLSQIAALYDESLGGVTYRKHRLSLVPETQSEGEVTDAKAEL